MHLRTINNVFKTASSVTMEANRLTLCGEAGHVAMAMKQKQTPVGISKHLIEMRSNVIAEVGSSLFICGTSVSMVKLLVNTSHVLPALLVARISTVYVVYDSRPRSCSSLLVARISTVYVV